MSNVQRPLKIVQQERRQAAQEAAGLVQSSAGEVGDGPRQHGAGLADRANNASGAEEEQAEKAFRNTSVAEDNNKAGQSEQEYPCLICDFVIWPMDLKFILRESI